MLNMLVLAALLPLAPAQTPALKLTNERITFGGAFGPTRPDNKILPGDTFFLGFDIENLKLDTQGKATFSIGVNVTDSAGKSVYEQKAAEQENFLFLGGNKLPGRAYMDTSLDMPAGQYNCRVTVTDLATKATATLDKKFEMLPKAFAIVRLFCMGDYEMRVPAPFHGVVGQALWLNFVVVDFQRDLKTRQPDIEIEMRALDADNKPVVEKPMFYAIRSGIAENQSGIPINLPVPMNRAGSFTVEIVAKDKVSGKSSKVNVPIKALAVAK